MGARARRTRSQERSTYPVPTRLLLVENDADELEEQLDDHESRLRGLERIALKVLGASALGGIVAGAITGVVLQAVIG